MGKNKRRSTSKQGSVQPGPQSRSVFRMSAECYVEVDKKRPSKTGGDRRSSAAEAGRNSSPVDLTPVKARRPSARDLWGFEGGEPCACSAPSEGRCVTCTRPFCRKHLRMLEGLVYCYVCVGRARRQRLSPRPDRWPTWVEESRAAAGDESSLPAKQEQGAFEARFLRGGLVNPR